MMRLQKFLSQAGIASRRKAEELIIDGKIKVNGKTAKKLGMTIDENNDEVSYQDKIITLKTKKIYIAINKPIGYISSTSDSQGKSVLSLIKIKEKIYPAGRLDKDSSGLLILTNDGELTQKLTHPSFGDEKEYFVTLDHDLREDDVKKLRNGLVIGGKKLQPVKVVSYKNKSARLVLKEGINRQIRRMLGKLNYTVIKLKRIRIGKLELGELEEGKWKKINKEDII